MKRFALFLLSLSIALGSLVPLAPKASATSVYDANYQTTSDTTYVNQSNSECNGYSVGTNWVSLVQASSYGSSFNEVFNAPNGDWGLTNAVARNEITPGVYANTFEVFYGYDLVLDWQTYSGYKWVTATGSSTQSLEITVNYNSNTHTCDYSVSNMFNSLIIVSIGPDGLNPGYKNVLFTGDPNYPTGYEGPEIETEYTPSTTYTPKFTVNVNGKDVSIILCSVASQCSLPPGFGSNQGIGWSITDSSDDVVVSGSGKILETAIVNTSVPNFGEYTVNVWYYAPIPFIQPADQIWNTMHLPIVVDGSTYLTGTGTQNCTDSGTCDAYTPYQQCFKPELPFIDLPACWHNLGVVGTLLSFDKIPMATDFNLGGSCRTLGTLGDWLGLTNKMVCPQFPSSIRDTITPFITFALALGAVSFMLTRTHSNRTF